MLIAENKLRKIIRKSLLEESFLTSAIEEIGHLKIDLGGKTYKLPAIGATKIDKKEVLVFTIPKKLRLRHGKRINFLKIKKLPNENYILNNKFDVGGKKKISKNAPTESARYYISKDDLKKSANIETSKEKLKTGKASMADYTIEIGGILGGIPAIGNAADVGTAILAMVKDPPDYLLAALSILCAIPAIGIGVAVVAKPLAQKYGGKAAKEAGEAVGRELKTALEKEGIEFSKELVEDMKEQTAEALSALKKSEILKKLAEKLNKEADELSKGFDEIEEVFEAMFKNFEDIGAGGTKLLPPQKEVVKASMRKSAALVMKSLNAGDMLNEVVKFSNDIANEVNEKLAGKINEKFAKYSKEYAATGKRADQQDLVATSKVLDELGEVFVGQKFKLPNPPGGEIVFKNANQFRTDAFSLARLIGIPDKSKFVGLVQKAIMNQPNYKQVTPENMAAVANRVVEKFKNIKFKASRDVKKLKSDFDISSGDLSGDIGVTFGAMQHTDPPTIFLNVAAFEKGLNSATMEEMVQTLEHEMLHSIDKLIVTATAFGDDAISAMINDKGIKFASNITASSVLNPKKLPGKAFTRKYLEDVVFKKLFSRNGFFPFEHFKRSSTKTGEELVSIIKEKIKQEGGNPDSYAGIVAFSKEIADKYDMPEIHARTIFYNMIFTSKYKSVANSDEFFDEIKDTVSYFGNTQEMLVRQQRLANYLKKEGYDIGNAVDLKQAFEELGFDKIVKNVKDLRSDPIFLGIFTDIKYSDINSEFAKQAFEFITAFTYVNKKAPKPKVKIPTETVKL